LANKNQGDSNIKKIPPINTIREGNPLTNIIALQFPSVKLFKNMIAKTHPKTFPSETKKLIITKDFPQNLMGVISDIIEVVRGMLNP